LTASQELARRCDTQPDRHRAAAAAAAAADADADAIRY